MMVVRRQQVYQLITTKKDNISKAHLLDKIKRSCSAVEGLTMRISKLVLIGIGKVIERGRNGDQRGGRIKKMLHGRRQWRR